MKNIKTFIIILLLLMTTRKVFGMTNSELLEQAIKTGKYNQASKMMRDEIIIQLGVKQILYNIYGWKFYFYRKTK